MSIFPNRKAECSSLHILFLSSLTQIHINSQSEALAVLVFKKLLIVPQVSGRLGGRYCFFALPVLGAMHGVWGFLCMRFVPHVWYEVLGIKPRRWVFCLSANHLRLLFIVRFVIFRIFTRYPLVVFWSKGHLWSLLFRTDLFEWLYLDSDNKMCQIHEDRRWIILGPSRIYSLYPHNSWKHRALRMSHLVPSSISTTNNSSVWQDSSVTCSKDEDCVAPAPHSCDLHIYPVNKSNLSTRAPCLPKPNFILCPDSLNLDCTTQDKNAVNQYRT